MTFKNTMICRYRNSLQKLKNPSDFQATSETQRDSCQPLVLGWDNWPARNTVEVTDRRDDDEPYSDLFGEKDFNRYQTKCVSSAREYECSTPVHTATISV